jgi:hypothetical protein
VSDVQVSLSDPLARLFSPGRVFADYTLLHGRVPGMPKEVRDESQDDSQRGPNLRAVTRPGNRLRHWTEMSSTAGHPGMKQAPG